MWKLIDRVALILVGAVISFCILFILLPALSNPDNYKRRLFNSLSRQWKCPSLLDGVSGYVYCTEYPQIKRFNIAEREWESLKKEWPYVSNFWSDEPWDVYGDLLAATEAEYCVGAERESLPNGVYRFGNPKPLLEFDEQLRAVRFSPTGRQLAVIKSSFRPILDREPEGGASEPLCAFNIMSIYELHCGELTEAPPIAQCPMSALPEGISWSPDGSKIAFVTIEDQTAFELKEGAGGNFTEEEIRIIDHSPHMLYLWDIAQNKTYPLVKGRHPDWSPDGESILFSRGSRQALVYSITEKREHELFTLVESYWPRFRWFGGTDKVLASVFHNGRPPGLALMVVIDVKNPERRHAIGQCQEAAKYVPGE